MSAVISKSPNQKWHKSWIPLESSKKPRIGKKVMVMNMGNSEKSVSSAQNIFWGIFLGQNVSVSQDGKSLVKKQMWRVPKNIAKITHWLGDA